MTRHPRVAALALPLISSFVLAVSAFSAEPGAPRTVAIGLGLDTPLGVAVQGAYAFVADFHNDRVRVIDHDGAAVASWGSAGSSPGQFAGPTAIAADPTGHVYVADLFNRRVQKFTAAGGYVTGWSAQANGITANPFGVAVDAAGDVWVTDLDGARVLRFSSQGTLRSVWGTRGAGAGQLADPWGVAIDAAGRVFVADHGNDRVQVFAANGALLASFGGAGSAQPLRGPMGIALDGRGFVYVTDLDPGRVSVFTVDGAAVGTLATSTATLLPGAAIGGARLFVTGLDTHALEILDTGVALDAPSARPVALAIALRSANPSRGPVTLGFAVPGSGTLSATVFDVHGRVQGSMTRDIAGPGEQTWTWRLDGNGPAPGVYFVRARFDGGTGTQSAHARVAVVR